MHPASQRPSRTGVVLKVGLIRLPVSVYGGTYKPPSKSTVCLGHDGSAHDPTKLVTRGQECPTCGDDRGNLEKAIKVGSEYVLVDAHAETAALEASDSHRNEMPLVRVDPAVYQQSVLESSDVFWLSPDNTDPLYEGLVEVLSDPNAYYVTRWASRKNVNLYRIVSRGGLLGMIKLLPAAELRAAPMEPLAIAEEAREQATLLIEQQLDNLKPIASADAMRELTHNPYKDTLEKVAEENEAEVKHVLTRKQNRGTFGDNLASTSLKAMLEEIEDGI